MGMQNTYGRSLKIYLTLKAVKQAFGTIKDNTNRKQTHWWNGEIKEQIKLKKKKWMEYFNNKTADNYNHCKHEQRMIAKNLVMAAKERIRLQNRKYIQR